jgi:hypothetical protein
VSTQTTNAEVEADIETETEASEDLLDKSDFFADVDECGVPRKRSIEKDSALRL